jgi:hypothetical protein
MAEEGVPLQTQLENLEVEKELLAIQLEEMNDSKVTVGESCSRIVEFIAENDYEDTFVADDMKEKEYPNRFHSSPTQTTDGCCSVS